MFGYKKIQVARKHRLDVNVVCMNSTEQLLCFVKDTNSRYKYLKV